MNVILYTAVWGAHVESFKNGTLKSLMWPKNYAAIKGCTWVIYTYPRHAAELEKLVKDAGFEPKIVCIGDGIHVDGLGPGPVGTDFCSNGIILLAGLRQQIFECITQRKKFLLMPPDTMCSDGTIPNLLNLGKEPGSSVAVAHTRVKPSFLNEVIGPLSSDQMVKLSWAHLHDSWAFAENGHPKNSSFLSGVKWERLSPDLIRVCHHLPTIYLIDFIHSDHEVAWGTCGFGYWDHTFPSYVARDGRLKYAGSSDACYIVELTEPDKNVPPDVPNQSGASFFRNLWHNEFFKQVEVIFRAG